MELKQPLTYQEQVERLSSFHKLTISDTESAISILKTVNYYRLSAYGIGLTLKGNKDEYKENISIDHLYKLYCFDRELREIIARPLEYLEIQLRTALSYYLSLKYGPTGYLSPSNFKSKLSKNGTDVHNNLINNFKTECQRQRNTPFVKHHLEKYNGNFPLWVATELFSFGNIASLYDIMLDEDRKEIAKMYNTDPQYLGSWVLSMVEIRNICAHFGRLYNMPLKQAPHLFKENRQYRTNKINKLFPVILVIKRMLSGNEEWRSFFTRLQSAMEQFDDVIILSFMGFPKNWIEVLS